MKKILLFGCGNGIVEALELIYQSEKWIEISAIVPRLDKDGSPFKAENFIKSAEDKSIPVLRSLDVNDPDFIKTIRKYNADLLCNWGHGQLFSKQLRESAILGCLNLHPGLLPFGRGSGAIHGEVINGAKYIGQTCHIMDDSFDGGIIVNSRKFELKGHEYLDEILSMLNAGAPQFFVESIKLCLEGKFERKYISRFGRYFPKFSPGDEVIDWSQTTQEIVKKIRSRSPERSSVAYILNQNKKFFVREVEPSDIDDYIFVPGQVIDKKNKGILVKTKDNALWITKASFDDVNFFTPTLKIGTNFLYPSAGLLLDLIEKINNVEKKLHEICKDD